MKCPILRKKNRKIIIINPYGSSLLKVTACLWGRSPTATLPPSRGGIGVILNIARITLIRALTLSIICRGTSTVLEMDAGRNADKGKITSQMIKILNTARIILVKGPAAAEIAISLLGSLKLLGLIGTGFAYPKVKPVNM